MAKSDVKTHVIGELQKILESLREETDAGLAGQVPEILRRRLPLNCGAYLVVATRWGRRGARALSRVSSSRPIRRCTRKNAASRNTPPGEAGALPTRPARPAAGAGRGPRRRADPAVAAPGHRPGDRQHLRGLARRDIAEARHSPPPLGGTGSPRAARPAGSFGETRLKCPLPGPRIRGFPANAGLDRLRG